MPRVKRGVQHVKRRRSILKQSKGFRWGRRNLLRQAKTAITKAGVHAYRDRKKKKRAARSGWLVQINAACRQHGISYSRFIDALKKHKIELDRKVLADIGRNHPQIFQKIVHSVTKK